MTAFRLLVQKTDKSEGVEKAERFLQHLGFEVERVEVEGVIRPPAEVEGVEGVKKVKRFKQRDGRTEPAIDRERREEILASVRREGGGRGSISEAARQLGITRQRVHQVVSESKAHEKEEGRDDKL